MLREAKAKGEAERFRQFSNQPPLHAPVIGLQTTDPRLACGQDQPQWIVAGMEQHTGTRENRGQGGGVTTTSSSSGQRGDGVIGWLRDASGRH